MTEQNNFGLEYESRLIGTLLRDRQFLHVWISIFDQQYLVSDIHKLCFSLIQDFYDQYKRPPDKLEMEIRLQEHLSREELSQERASNEFALAKFEIDKYFQVALSEMEFVKDTALKYCQQAALKKAILECAGLVDTPKAFKMPDIIQKALAVGTNLDNFGLDYFEERRIRSMMRYSQPRESNRIPFFIPKFDDSIGGVGFRRDGSGTPELLMFGGGPNVGKSRAIAHMVKVGASLGHHGLVCSSEMAEDLYAERLDMSYSLLDTPGLYDPNNFDHIQRRLEFFANQGAKLFIKKYPAGSTTIRQTLALARLIENTLGIDLSFIAWDYTSEFKSEENYEKRNDAVASIIRAQKMACDELGCAGIGAFQLNRDGMRQEMAHLDNAAEDITVARVADTCIILAQTDEEYDKDPPEMRWCARKVRAADRNQTVLLIDDRKRMRFTQHPSEEASSGIFDRG